MANKTDERILKAIEKITAKRPRTVVDHILTHGHITTQDLESKYGYNHPPRAARDVREAGIPLETFSVLGRDGRRIAAYRFGDPGKIEQHKLAGRRVFPKDLKDTLYARARQRCEICQTPYDSRYLQIDHRTPYEVSGDTSAEAADPADFMLLCGSCQRSKSWTCESCENWKASKNTEVCSSCYWADVESHTHIAQKPVRRTDISWVGEEVAFYDSLRKEAGRSSISVSQLIKGLLTRDE